MHTARVLPNPIDSDHKPMRRAQWVGLLLLVSGMAALAPQARADGRYNAQGAVAWGYQGPAYPPLVRVQPAPLVPPHRYLRSYTDPRPVVVWQPPPRAYYRHGNWHTRHDYGHHHGYKNYYAPPVKQYGPVRYVYR